jgi:hypothetical protein
MSGEFGEQEVLAQGRDRAPRAPRTGGPRRRRGAVMTVAVLGLLGGAGYTGYALMGPRLPAIGVAETPDETGDMSQTPTPWQPGVTGRPVGRVKLTFGAVFTPDRSASGKVTVLGMAGPGVTEGSAPSIALAADRPTMATLTTEVDCTKVPLPVVPSAYGMRVHVVDGSRQVDGTVPAGSMAGAWAQSLDKACGSWLARQDLTVTQVSATVDALRPSADLTLTIANAGHRDAFVAGTGADDVLAVSARPPGEITVPPDSVVRVLLHVDVPRCDAVPPPPTNGDGETAGTTGDYLGLVAFVGVHPGAGQNQFWMDGLGPTGMVLARGAASAVAEALRSACGGIGPYVTLIAPHGLDFQRGTGVLTVRIQIDGTPGRVSDLRLFSTDGPAGGPSSFIPLWTSTATLVPDRTGQVTTTLRYRAPSGTADCPFHSGTWIPAFSVVAHLPVPGGVKTLRYAQLIDPESSPESISAICPSLEQ